MAFETPLSKANTSFALALFKALGDKDRASNVFYSPLTISSAFAMVLLGAKGNTVTQISECLKFEDCKDLHPSFASLLKVFELVGTQYAISVANRLYGEKTQCFLQDFLGGTREYYKAELESVDFVNNAEKARVDINTWVEMKTEGKIKSLLVQGVVHQATKLVLINAIYFRGHWKTEFQKKDTRVAPFKLNENETKPVKMMHQKSKFPFRHIHEANCKVIELPYKGKHLSMLILLPDGFGLEKLQQQLTYENFVEWTCPDKMPEVLVRVALPQFTMEEKYELKKALTGMGMVDAFDPSKSDFSGISPSKDLVLSEVIHKAFVEVNEEGTEAAAATEAKMENCVIPTFIADQPFLFFIRHNLINSVLFAGRYCTPE